MATQRQTDDEACALADSELESVLQTAYAAPAVPRSLMQRIDAGIAAEWNSDIAPASPAPERGTSRLSRLLQRRSLLAAAAVVAMIGVFVLNSPGGSAWAATLQAMARQGLIELRTDGGFRWLSLRDGLVGETNATESRLLDVRKQVLLTRRVGESTAYRQPVAIPAEAADEQVLAVAFLAGLDGSSASGVEHWRIVEAPEVSQNRQDGLILHVERSNAAPVVVQLRIDPESRLPVETVIADGPALPVSYPEISPQQALVRAFPRELRIVDAAPPELSSTSAVLMAMNASNARDGDKVQPGDLAVVQSTGAIAEVLPYALAAAPSTWPKVEPIEGDTDAFVAAIDEQLKQLWDKRGVEPAPAASDVELLRRLYLDLAGRTPTVHEVRSFLKDADPKRYERLVDRLLSSSDHASHVATVWRSYLIPDGIDLTAFGGVEAFDKWLAEQFARSVPYDEIVRGLLLAEGRLAQSGPLLFYSAAKLDPEQLAARTSRVFLGLRLECAQCHDHPFEPWKQQDFWSLAAFFSRISRPQGELAAASRVMRVHDVDRGDVTLPDTETVIPPRFLNAAQPLEEQEGAARRQELADWVTSPSNPYFARATANRIWGMMFGRGIVNPVDDFGVRNPPASPELLELLAGRLVSRDFDLRELFRGIALSRAYRLSSGAEDHDDRRLECFAQMNVKVLTAEQIYDCITVATLIDSPAAAGESFNLARFDNADREAFLQQFRTPPGRATEYQGGIPQALTLMNGGLIQNATGLGTSGLLQSLAAPFFSNPERIEILYLATLSRPPNDTELRVLGEYIPENAAGNELQQGLADVLWVLLNSAEFVMNH